MHINKAERKNDRIEYKIDRTETKNTKRMTMLTNDGILSPGKVHKILGTLWKINNKSSNENVLMEIELFVFNFKTGELKNRQ